MCTGCGTVVNSEANTDVTCPKCGTKFHTEVNTELNAGMTFLKLIAFLFFAGIAIYTMFFM